MQPLLVPALARTHTLTRAPRHDVVRDLLGLQAQFSRNPELSLRLRAQPEDAPWDEGLVKIWAHRGTMYVVNRAELGLYLSAADRGGDFQDGWWGMSAEEQRFWAPFIQERLGEGPQSREDLKQACRDAGMDGELLAKAFYGWGGLIKEMVGRGMLVCSTGTDKSYALAGPVAWMDRDDARRVLIRRYFHTFGPASKRDCAAFFGYPMRELQPLLHEILPQLDRMALDGTDYYFVHPLPEADVPDCVLLPGFDALVMAYRDRARLIDPKHLRKLVNLAGIVFPAAILRGRVRARWKLEGDKVTVTPFERLYKKDEAALRRAAKRMLNAGKVTFE